MTASDFISALSAGATRIVHIGGVPKKDLRSRLQTAGIRCNEAAERLFGDDRFLTSSDKTLLETVEVSAGGLA